MPSGFLGGGMGPRAFGGGGLPDPVPVAGAELVVNGDMELDASWSNSGSPSTNERSSEQAHGGTYSRKIVQTANDDGITQSRALVFGYFAMSAWLYPVGAGMARLMVYTGGYLPSAYTTLSAGSWQQLHWHGRWSALVALYIQSRLPSNPWYADDVSLKQLTLASLLSTRLYASPDCDISAAVTRTAGTQAGLCARLDSASSPANFIIAYETGEGRVRVDKCVAGVYTNIIDGAVTYAAGRVLRLVCAGNDVSVYYNDVQVGSTQTVADAGIVSNTRHGKFSTYASNTLANYVAA